MKIVKYGGFSVMVWGLIKADGTRTFIRFPHIMNSMEYQSVLSRRLLTVYNYNDIFVQNGAPCHRSASMQKYLDSKFICVINDWPPHKPDLNIIENMWSILKGKVRKDIQGMQMSCGQLSKKNWIVFQRRLWYNYTDSSLVD